DPLDRAILKSITRFHDTRLEPALRTLFPSVGNSGQIKVAKESVAVMNEHLDRLDVLVNPRPYLGGETLSLADCAYATTLFMMEDIANSMGLSPRVSQKISGWRNTLYATDVVRQIIDQNRAAIAAWIATKLN
ncbi:MAG: glutathione S-transferase family protein, partial [Arenicellales bacterium]